MTIKFKFIKGRRLMESCMSDKLKVAQQFMSVLPHAHALGMEIISFSDGEVELAMNYDERFVGDPETGVVHGGAVSALMDSCCGAAAMSHPDNSGPTVTIDLRIDYMRSATPGQRIKAKAECYHVTRAVAFVRAQAFDHDESRPVATASGTFSVAIK